MKNYLVSGLALLLFLTSCNDAYFDRYPGTPQAQIPEQYRGHYKEDKPKNKTKEWYDIGADYYIEYPKGEKHMLGDSFVFSNYNGIDFISVLHESDPYWTVMNLKAVKNKIYFYPVNYNPKQNDDRLKDYITPQLLPGSTYVFKMNEEKLAAYLKEYLWKQDPVVMKRFK